MTDNNCQFADVLESALEVSYYDAGDCNLIEKMDALLGDCMAYCSDVQLHAVLTSVFGGEVLVCKARWELQRLIHAQSEHASSNLQKTIIELGKVVGLETFTLLANLASDESCDLAEDGGAAFDAIYKDATQEQLVSCLKNIDPLLSPRQFHQFIRGNLRVVMPNITKHEALCCDMEFDLIHGFDDVVAALLEQAQSSGKTASFYKACSFTYSILTPAQRKRLVAYKALEDQAA